MIDITLNNNCTDNLISWTIDDGDTKDELYIRSDFKLSAYNSIYPLALFTSMVRGKQTSLSSPCSDVLMQNGKKIESMFRDWFPRLHRSSLLRPEEHVSRAPEKRGVGLFFTGGADSFFSLLENNDHITDLIFVHGFDIKLDNTELRDEVSRSIRNIASHYGKNLIEIETNIKQYFCERLNVSWPFSHGAGLAVAAHALSKQIEHIYLASSHTFPDDSKLGTHPELDIFWSSEYLKFVHHGYSQSRFEKIRRIAKSDYALSELRVCWENKHNHYNCGECEKCLRTMLSMMILGCLQKKNRFASEFSEEKYRNLDCSDSNNIYYSQEHLDVLKACDGNERLIKMLEDTLTTEP